MQVLTPLPQSSAYNDFILPSVARLRSGYSCMARVLWLRRRVSWRYLTWARRASEEVQSRGVLLSWGVRTDTSINVVCRPLKRWQKPCFVRDLLKHVHKLVECSELEPLLLNHLNDPNKICSALTKKIFVISATRFQRCSESLKHFRGFGHLILWICNGHWRVMLQLRLANFAVELPTLLLH